MSRRVGRPSKEYIFIRYSEAELNIMLRCLDKSEKNLITKIRLDLKERKRLHKNYEKAKARIFKTT